MDSRPQNQPVDWQHDPEFINLSAISAFIKAHIKALGIAFIVSSAVGIGVALIVPLYFTATASLLPSEPASPMSRLASQFGGMAGFGSRSKSLVELYPEIARSKTVLTDMLNTGYRDSTFRYALTQEIGVYEVGEKLEDEIMRHLRSKLDASLDPVNNFIKISFTAYDPVLAADLVNAVVHRMDEFLRERLHTESHEQTDLITRRLADEANLLRQSEERLLNFREKNRAVTLSPTALMEQARLVREVEIHNALYVELTKQLEVTRIDAYRQAPVLTVLDWAVPPVKKSGPMRSLIVLGFVLVGVAGTAAMVKWLDGKT